MAQAPRKTKTAQPKIRQSSKEPGRAPLVAAYRAIEQHHPDWSRWALAESHFLQAMYDFDLLVASGIANQGDRQNGKGDFFNDLVALLLERCSGKDLFVRPDVAGLSFPRHDLDAAYPATGTVQLTIETKATGVPLHPGNTKQKNSQGRPGAADLDKRVKEASLKNIDIKAEVARLEGKGGGATSDLSEWLKQAPPKCYMLLSCRVTDDNDLDRCKYFARIAANWFDSCGLVAYGLSTDGKSYEAKALNDTNLEMDRVLARICTTLRNLP